MAVALKIDPYKLGSYEKAGWEAYYARNWAQVLRLMVQLNREQFGLTGLAAALAALDTVRAMVAFAPVENDLVATQRHLQSYYTRVQRVHPLQTLPETLAALELQYWVVHRELAAKRKLDQTDMDIEPMIDALARVHAAIFESTPERMRVSATLRAMAAVTVDRITGGYSTDIAGDWQRVERLLQQAYQAVLIARQRTTPIELRT